MTLPAPDPNHSQSPPHRRRPVASQIWMVTFVDLVALLLAFFVMLFSMSSLTTERWATTARAFSEYLDSPKESETGPAPAHYKTDRMIARRGANVDYLQTVIGQRLGDNLAAQGIEMVTGEDRLLIFLPDAMFKGDNAIDVGSPKGQSDDVLVILGGVLRNVSNEIAVTGTGPDQAALLMDRAAVAARAFAMAGYDRVPLIAARHGPRRGIEITVLATPRSTRGGR